MVLLPVFSRFPSRLLHCAQLGCLWGKRESVWVGRDALTGGDPLLGSQATDFLDVRFVLGIMGCKSLV